MNKDWLRKTFVSLREIKQELYAKSFKVNDIRENLPLHVELRTSKTSNVTWKTGHVTTSGLLFAVNSDVKFSIVFLFSSHLKTAQNLSGRHNNRIL